MRVFSKDLSGKRYDAVVSLGQWCATSLLLRKLGMRFASGPFDWLLGQSVFLKDYVRLLATRFAGFLSKEDLVRIGEDVAERHAHYRDERTGFVLRHDFDIDVPFDTMYPSVHEKYTRRADRLVSALDAGKHLLFVHFRGEGHYDENEMRDSLSSLRASFPKGTIDLLVLESENGLNSPRTESVAPGLVRVVGDFYDESRFDAVMGNENLLLGILRPIRVRGRLRNLLRLKIQKKFKKVRRHFQ